MEAETDGCRDIDAHALLDSPSNPLYTEVLRVSPATITELAAL